jgi:predicted PurR-regulated permease PerM
MLGLDAKAARAAWTVFLVALAILVVYQARGTIVVFLLALFFAHLLAPAVDFIARFFPKAVSRTWSLAIVYCVLVALICVFAFAVGSRIAAQAAALASRMPELLKIEDPLAAIPFPSWLSPEIKARVIDAARDQLKTLNESALPLLQKFAGQVLSQAGNVLTAVLIPILSFFLLKDASELRQGILQIAVFPQTRKFMDEILDDLNHLLAQYIRALVGLSLSTLIVYSMYLEFTGVPYGFLLAGIAGILEFIPVVGPLIAAATVIIVAGAAGYAHVAWIVIFVILFRLFQDYVLSPYLMGQGVELHPLLVLFGVLAGDQIAGIPGMFFSVPLIAALRVIFLRVQKARWTHVA